MNWLRWHGACRDKIKPGMRESEVAAMIEGTFTTSVLIQGKVEMARAFTLVWSGPGIATFTRLARAGY